MTHEDFRALLILYGFKEVGFSFSPYRMRAASLGIEADEKCGKIVVAPITDRRWGEPLTPDEALAKLQQLLADPNVVPWDGP